MNNAMFLALEETGSVAVLRGELVVGGGSVRQSSELVAGVVYLSLREAMGGAWKPLSVSFTHPAPRDPAVHRRVFGRAVRFGADFSGIAWSRRDLGLRNERADPVMARYAREIVDATFVERQDFSGQVREAVLAQLARGETGIDAAAQRMAMSRRSMHRMLAREGQTFSAIVGDVRRELASRYVGDPNRSLAEISELLGFGAPSAFSRWYRREFAASPSRARSAKKAKSRA